MSRCQCILNTCRTCIFCFDVSSMDIKSIQYIQFIILMLSVPALSAKQGNNIGTSGFQQFGGTDYFASQDKLSWQDASVACQSHGMSLAAVESIEEHNFISQLIRDVNGQDKSVWISGNDLDTEGVWKWASTNEVLDFTNWDGGQPNGGYNESCMIMSQGDTWADKACTSPYHYVCEKVSAMNMSIDNLTSTSQQFTTTNPSSTTDQPTTEDQSTTTTMDSSTSIDRSTTPAELTSTIQTYADTSPIETTTPTPPTTTIATTTTYEGETTNATGNSLLYSVLSGSVSTNNLTSFIPTALEITTTSGQNIAATTQNSIIPATGTCACDATSKTFNWTQEALEESLNELRNELLVPKNSTSKAKRKLKCADDDRPSSRTVGFIGIIILSFLLGLMALSDIHSIVRYLEQNSYRDKNMYDMRNENE